MKNYFFKKSILSTVLVVFALMINLKFSDKIVLGQVPANFEFENTIDMMILKDQQTICTFNNTKMAILSIVKNATGIASTGLPSTFYFNTFPTPALLEIKADQLVDKDKYQYTKKSSMLIDPGDYKILETVPSFNWLMKNVSCTILPVCGDKICDTSTEVGENYPNCPQDCERFRPLSSPPPSQLPPILPGDPTGDRISNKNGIENVELIVGRTTECVFDNELMALKIVSDVIGGDGTETFDYNIKGYDLKSPSMTSNHLSVATNQKVREDNVRGDEWSGSEGRYLPPAVTSYVITEEISDGWTLNSVVCEMQGGKRTGIPTIYNHGVINVTIEPDKVTTCTFKKTKKGDIRIIKNAEKAEEGEEFNYDINFVSTDYLLPGYLAISTPLPKATVKVDKNGLGSFLFKKFTAVSDSGIKNRAMVSDDGKKWVIGESPKNREGDYLDNDWQSVAYGKGMFVAVASSGLGNRVMTSDDGKKWIIREGPKDQDGNYVDNDWQSVVYGKGMFVAVASSGKKNRVMTSNDGKIWIIGKSPKNIKGDYVDNDWQSVAYGKGMFVAVASSGTENRVMTSEDGKIWVIGKSPKNKDESYVDNDWQSVAYGKGMFVVVSSSGQGNRVMTSEDGKKWTIQKSATDNNWQSVAYGKGMFVAVANSGSVNRVMNSFDGIKWNSAIIPVVNNWQSVAYGKGMFVAVASSGSGNRIATSEDGKSWVLRESPKDKDGNYLDNSWRGAGYFDSGLYPGIYRVIENLPKASSDKNVWSLKNVKCVLENGDPTGVITVRGLENVSVYAGKTTTCTFNNVLMTKLEAENSERGVGGGGATEPRRPEL